MALTAIYERFLASPNPLSLSENASLHYIPTLTSYSQSGPIIRHLESQKNNMVKMKSQKVINAVEGASSVALEVDTTMEFIGSGGAYLSDLDNFIIDKIAILPIIHIVQFGQDQKISQIRISWDQASLLKQTDVIGSRGRNWPVSDGKEQVRLVTSSVSNTTAPKMPTSPTSPRGRNTNENGHAPRNPSPSKKVIKDPYTSLDTYWSQENEQSRPQSSNTVIAPRAESFKPPPRDMSEIFAAGHEDNEPGSPKKSAAVPVVAPKGASNQKYGPMRVFEEEEEASIISPKIYKTNPARYDHFDIGDSPEHDPLQHKSGAKGQSKAVPLTARTNKHASQWDFADFSTPHKVPTKERPEDKVHFSWNDENENKAAGESPGRQRAAQKGRRDAEAQFEFKDDGTPVERKVVPKPRKDANAHFDFDDQPTPAPTRIIARTDAAKGLYRNMLDEEDQPLSNISNNANAGRRHDFDGSHWQMNDDSPANSKPDNENMGVGHNPSNYAQNMGANWGNYDQSPEQSKRPTTTSKAFNKKGLEPQWGVHSSGEEVQPRRPKGHGTQKGIWDF